MSWTERLQRFSPATAASQKETKLFPVTDFLTPGDSFMIKRIECSTAEMEAKSVREGNFAVDNPHPRICRCYEVRAEDKPGGGRYVYLRLERMPKSFLQDIEERKEDASYYTESELWRILREAIAVYTFLQQRVSARQNLVHRDIKPGNILFDNERHVKVCDLGFMKVIDPDAPDEHTMLGTVPYFSPVLRTAYINKERPLHNTFKSDVYALGMSMLHASLLDLPPKLTVLKNLKQELKSALERMPYSQQWANILARMLAMEEEDRPDFLQLTEEIRRELRYSESEPMSNYGFTDIMTPLLVTAKCGLEFVRVGPKRYEKVPCMVSLHAINTDPSARCYATDFVCVIDESGSMNTAKMRLVKDTLNGLVQMLKATDRLSLITFSDTAELKCPLIPCDQPGRVKLAALIQQLTGRSNTNITAGMVLAAEVMEQRQFPNTGAAILLFTDGQHNVGEGPLAACRERINRPVFQAAKVRICTFGYGEDSDTALLSSIAEEGHGVYRFIAAASGIQAAFALAFAEIVTIVAKDVEVRVTAVPGPVHFAIEKMYTKDNAEFFALPDIIANQTKDLVFFIKAPYTALADRTPMFPAVHVVITYMDHQKQVIREEKDVMVECRPWASERDPGKSTSVFVNWYRVKGADVLRETRETANNNPLDAIQKLNFADEDISSSRYDFHPVIKSLLEDIRSVRTQLETTHHIDKNLAAQLQMVSYSHLLQVGTGPQSYYRSQQQREAVKVITGLGTVSGATAASEETTSRTP